MPTALIIISIISAVFALVIELLCSDQSARVVWLGALCLFYIMNAGFYLILSKNSPSMPVTKQIIVFLTVGIASAVISMVVATIVIGVTVRKEDETEKDGERKTDGEDTENES